MNPAISLNNNPFRAGEQVMHEQLGIRQRMLDIGKRVIRTAVSEQHQRFFEQLRFMLAGSVDAANRPWASTLVGLFGFVQPPDAKRLNLKVQPIPGDPLAERLSLGAQRGFSGIELHTRRRNRVRGHVVMAAAQGVGVRQLVWVFLHYMQRHDLQWVGEAGDLIPRSTDRLSEFDADARALIERSVTLFITTQTSTGHNPDVQTGPGTDVSHHGSRSGFVIVEDESTFLVPDFMGNIPFMTVGNLHLSPRAGAPFVDFGWKPAGVCVRRCLYLGSFSSFHPIPSSPLPGMKPSATSNL